MLRKCVWFVGAVFLATSALGHGAVAEGRQATGICRIEPAGSVESSLGVWFPIISGNGRYVAFGSSADNYVGDDTNGTGDVFLYDRSLKNLARISLSSSGEQGDGESFSPAISSDGRFVAFVSKATNFVPVREPGWMNDVYLHDSLLGTTTLVSANLLGERGNGLGSQEPAISADGRFVAFVSHASDLVANDTNDVMDVFVRDTLESTTERVSITSSGEQARANCYGVAMSADARYVAFCSAAGSLTEPTEGAGIYYHDRWTQETSQVPCSWNELLLSRRPYLSPDGSTLAYLRFRQEMPEGAGFAHPGCDLVLYDVESGAKSGIIERVAETSASRQIGEPHFVSFSWNARYVAFDSETAFVDDDLSGWRDVYLFDRATVSLSRISMAMARGDEANGDSSHPSLSYQGTAAVFVSHSNNLVPSDTNCVADAFMWRSALTEHPVHLPYVRGLTEP